MADYDYWHGRLAAKRTGAKPPALEETAECGFWRFRREPLAIWRDKGGDLMRKLGMEPPQLVDFEWSERVFSRACSDPITEQAYRDRMAGKPWPDDPPATLPEPIVRPAPAAAGSIPGHNLGPAMPEANEDLPTIKAELEAERKAIDEWLKPGAAKVIIDQETCDKAANWASRILDLEKKLEDGFKAEKKFWLDGGRAVDTKWREPRGTAEELKKTLKQAQLPYLSEQDRLRREREAAEAERLRKERLAAHLAAAKAQEEALVKGKSEQEAREAAERAAEASRPAAPAIEQNEIRRNTNAGSVGRKTSLTKTWVGVIEDWDKALMALKNHGELKALVQQLADRAAKAQIPVDGIRFEQKEGVR